LVVLKGLQNQQVGDISHINTIILGTLGWRATKHVLQAPSDDLLDFSLLLELQCGYLMVLLKLSKKGKKRAMKNEPETLQL